MAAPGDTIAFDASLAGTTLVLTQGELVAGTNLSIGGDIDGDGKADIIISGGADGSGDANTGDGQIFTIENAATLTLRSLTLTEGYATDTPGSPGAAARSMPGST